MTTHPDSRPGKPNAVFFLHVASTVAMTAVVVAAFRNRGAAGLAGWLLVIDVTVTVAIALYFALLWFTPTKETHR